MNESGVSGTIGDAILGPTGIFAGGNLTAIRGGMAQNAYSYGSAEAVWSETKQMPAPAEAPAILGFSRYGQTLAVGDLCVVAASVLIAGSEPMLSLWAFLASALASCLAWMFILRLYDARPDGKAAKNAVRITLAAALATVSAYLMLRVSGSYVPAAVLGEQALMAWSGMLCWRFFHELVSRLPARKIPVLVAGAGSRGMAVYNLLKAPNSPFKFAGFLDDNIQAGPGIGVPMVVGTCLEVAKAAALTGAKQVIVAMPHDRDSESVRTITQARMNGLVVREMTDLYEEMAGRIPVNYIDDNWLISARGFSLLYDRYLRFTKRLVDAVFSGILGLFLLPVFLLVALFIKLDSSGPVFYRQERVGADGKVFTIFKFRSMIENAESNGACWAKVCDPRVTRVGRYLRKFRLDELPQIWNIIKGEMSFIGPRPERPEFVAVLDTQIPYYSVRHTVKPGVTGWAQVILRYGASVNDAMDKLEADLYYIKNMSPLLDLKILMRTIGVVLLAQGSR